MCKKYATLRGFYHTVYGDCRVPRGKRENVIHLYQDLKNISLTVWVFFSYSQEEGTPAAEMEGQIDEEEKEFRRDSVLNTQSSISLDRNQARVDKTYEVLVEGMTSIRAFIMVGPMREAPDVDGKNFCEDKGSA